MIDPLPARTGAEFAKYSLQNGARRPSVRAQENPDQCDRLLLQQPSPAFVTTLSLILAATTAHICRHDWTAGLFDLRSRAKFSGSFARPVICRKASLP
jgi:hypothetical protein